jgi:capsular polysaccharide biosynthesis protein/Mrp family chromosome partitioning ATPase
VEAPARANLDPSSDEAPIDGQRMAAALRAAAVPIALAVLAVTLLTLLLSGLATERYRATARIIDTSTASDTSGGTDRQLATAQALITNPDVLAAAARRVPGESPSSLRAAVSAAIETEAEVLDVRATSTSKRTAAAIANAVARTFLDRQAATERASIRRVRARLRAQLAVLGADPTNAAQVSALQARLSELLVQEANAGSDLQLAEAARPPSAPYAPRPVRNAVIAFFAALLAATFVVVVRERLRPRIGSSRELGRLAGVPVLASLPPRSRSVRAVPASSVETLARRAPGPARAALDAVAGRLRRADDHRESRDAVTVEDAVRSLLGTVLLELPPDRRHLLAVTSPRRDASSARVTAELGRALARAGQPTLVLSAELGSPALARALGVPPVPGLAERLGSNGGSPLLAARPVPGQDGLDVLPAGGRPPDGVGLLRPGALDSLMSALGRTAYRYVIVDAPALDAPEARLVAQRAEAVLLACAERSSAQELADARAALERSGVTPLGAVTAAPGPSVLPPAPARAGRWRPVLAHHEAGAALALEPDRSSPNGAQPTDDPLDDVPGHLRAAGRSLSAAELRTALGDPPAARVRSRLRRLLEDGEIVRVGSGTRGDPYRYGPRDEA